MYLPMFLATDLLSFTRLAFITLTIGKCGYHLLGLISGYLRQDVPIFMRAVGETPTCDPTPLRSTLKCNNIDSLQTL
jgi:hypothetical protein